LPLPFLKERKLQPAEKDAPKDATALSNVEGLEQSPELVEGAEATD
jgi:hypothetical protein